MQLLGFGVFFLTVLCSVDSAKILAFYSFPFKSHHIIGSELLKGLAKKGHQVTMISPYPLKAKIPNYTDIEVDGILKYKEETIDKVLSTIANGTSIFMFAQAGNWMNDMMEISLNNTAVQNLLTSGETYDVMIMEGFAEGACIGIAHKLNAQVVLLNPIGPTSMVDKVTGNTSPYAYIPHFLLPYSSEMTFLQRVLNTIVWELFDVVMNYFSKQEEIYKKYFPDSPSMQEMYDNISLALVNAHYSLDFPRPYVPNVIPIGGFHVQESKEVTGKLKTFLDNAKEGVILLCFGSNIRMTDLSKETVNAFIKVFAKLPMKVLWKSEIDIPNRSKNVYIENWIPQNDVLGHPNLKLFISHGGFGGVTEAINNAVPIIGIPFFADQSKNVAECVQKGFALHLEVSNVTEESLESSIKEVLNNPKYRKNIEKASSFLNDQPIKPMDLANFWIEHIIRHKDAKHLKNNGTKLNFFQYLLLDVVSFLIVSLILILAIFYYVIKLFVRFLRKKLTGKKKSKTQ